MKENFKNNPEWGELHSYLREDKKTVPYMYINLLACSPDNPEINAWTETDTRGGI